MPCPNTVCRSQAVLQAVPEDQGRPGSKRAGPAELAVIDPRRPQARFPPPFPLQVRTTTTVFRTTPRGLRSTTDGAGQPNLAGIDLRRPQSHPFNKPCYIFTKGLSEKQEALDRRDKLLHLLHLPQF